MSQKDGDTLLALLGLIFIGIGIAFVSERVWTGFRDMESSARWTERKQESAITPGKPPILPTPPGGTPASAADAALWISNDDYPEEALEKDWQGRVSIGWVIGADGKVEDCYVVESSGHSVLDEAACRAIKRNGHYEPAHDANGLAIRATDRRRVIWRLPD